MDACLLHELLERLPLHLHLGLLLPPLLVRPLTHVLVEHLLTLLRRQQEVARVEHDLVQLLLPRRERGDLLLL